MGECCTTFSEHCEGVLRDHGLRITKTRLLIASSLEKFSTPFTPKDVHRDLVANSTCDFATVYRTLITYSELGVIHQVSPSGKYVICNAAPEVQGKKVHVIYRCENCSFLEERQLDQEIMSMIFYLAKKSSEGFQTKSAMLELAGRCKSCVNQT